mgnify:CR=1 FL=1
MSTFIIHPQNLHSVMPIKKVSMRNRIFGTQNLKGDLGNNGLLEWWNSGTIKTGNCD